MHAVIYYVWEIKNLQRLALERSGKALAASHTLALCHGKGIKQEQNKHF